MQEAQRKPLAVGLLGQSSGSFYGQVEIHLRDYNTLDFIIRRRMYSNLPDVEFSMDNRDLGDVIDILTEAKKKLQDTLNVHYFRKLQPVPAKKDEKKSAEPLIKPSEEKENGPPGCPNYLGYLATRPMDKPLPQECRVCPMVLECAMKVSRS